MENVGKKAILFQVYQQFLILFRLSCFVKVVGNIDSKEMDKIKEIKAVKMERNLK